MLSKTFIVAGCCLLTAGAMAEESPLRQDDPAKEPVRIGAATDALLEMQRSQIAAGTPQAMQGEAASRAYQRYLDGFRQPVAKHASDSTPAKSADR